MPRETDCPGGAGCLWRLCRGGARPGCWSLARGSWLVARGSGESREVVTQEAATGILA